MHMGERAVCASRLRCRISADDAVAMVPSSRPLLDLVQLLNLRPSLASAPTQILADVKSPFEERIKKLKLRIDLLGMRLAVASDSQARVSEPACVGVRVHVRDGVRDRAGGETCCCKVMGGISSNTHKPVDWLGSTNNSVM